MNTDNNIAEIQNKIGQYEQFLKVDPKNPQLLINLGDLYHRLSDFDKAVNYYRKSLELDDSDITRSRLASIKISQHQFDAAEEMLLGLVEKEASNPALLFNLGLAQYHQRKWSEAETNFRKALEHGSDNAIGQEYLIHTLHHQHKFDEAKTMCHSWIDQSGSTKARGYLALLEMDSGQGEKAREIANAVLEEDPDNIDAGIVVGISDIEEQDIDVAIEQFERVLANQPDHPRALFGLGLSHLHQQHHDQAITLMEQAAKQMPRDTGIRVAMGWAKTTQQDFKGAEAIFREVIELDRNFSEGYGGLAYILALQGKINEARDAMQRAQWLDPGSFGAAASQSVLLGIEQGTDKATEFLANALEMPPAPGQKPILDHIRTYIEKHGAKQTGNTLEHEE